MLTQIVKPKRIPCFGTGIFIGTEVFGAISIEFLVSFYPHKTYALTLSRIRIPGHLESPNCEIMSESECDPGATNGI